MELRVRGKCGTYYIISASKDTPFRKILGFKSSPLRKGYQNNSIIIFIGSVLMLSVSNNNMAFYKFRIGFHYVP
jgi:hypothetical protein